MVTSVHLSHFSGGYRCELLIFSDIPEVPGYFVTTY